MRHADVDLGDFAEHQRRLTARHREIDVEKDLRVEQCAVQLAMRVVDVVALAERVEAVALARVHLPRERQRVDHRQRSPIRRAAARQTLQLRIEESDIECRVVDDELRAVHELEQLVDDLREARLLREERVGDAVHILRGAIDRPVRAQVAVKAPAGLAAIDQLDAADLDDAMSLLRLQPRGFGVETTCRMARSDRRAHRLDDAGLLSFGQVRMHRQADHVLAGSLGQRERACLRPRSANTGCRCSGIG